MFRLRSNEWRLNPDQDRRNGPVSIRKMTPEELQQYGQPVSHQSKPGMTNIKYLRTQKPPTNLKMTEEQLQEEIALHGTGAEACRLIAQKYGYDEVRSVGKRINRYLKRQGN